MLKRWEKPDTSCLTCRVWRGGWICLASMRGYISRIHSSSCSIHVCFFLKFTNVFLVSDSFIPKPVGNLKTETKQYTLLLKTALNGEHSTNEWTSMKFIPKWWIHNATTLRCHCFPYCQFLSNRMQRWKRFIHIFFHYFFNYFKFTSKICYWSSKVHSKSMPAASAQTSHISFAFWFL